MQSENVSGFIIYVTSFEPVFLDFCQKGCSSPFSFLKG
jgi:hypothetical protein